MQFIEKLACWVYTEPKAKSTRSLNIKDYGNIVTDLKYI